jgi:hypothetical protein
MKDTPSPGWRRREPLWRVLWGDWRDHHDWIGPRFLKKGGAFKPQRARPPNRQTRDFLTRDGRELRRRVAVSVPEGELVAQIVSLPKLDLVSPANLLLPGDWPLQRCDKGAW